MTENYNPEEKINMVYIVGFPHSGTTLLNRILGTSKNCFAVGELNHLEYAVSGKKGRVCDDGTNLIESKFWKNVLDGVNVDKLIPLDTQQSQKLKLTFSLGLFGKKSMGGITKENLVEEEKLYANLLKEAKGVKGKTEYLVESSKSLKRLMALGMSDKINLKVIHIVRDGRGVVYSHEKRNKSGTSKYFNWLFSNFLTRRYLSKQNSIKLSYDQFVQDPLAHLERINDQFGLEIDLDNFIEDVNKEKFYTFSGNPMRFKKLEGIRYDQAWRKAMPKWKQMILSVLTYIPNRVWVY